MITAPNENVLGEMTSVFHLDVLLAEGPSSGIWLARERGTCEHVVLKTIPRTRGDADDERFGSAMRAATTLDHPNIVAVHRWGCAARNLWCTMRYVRGRSLRTMLDERGPLDMPTAVKVLEPLAGALSHAHARGVTHGSIKPENVLLDARDTAHFTDFGLARALMGHPPATEVEDQEALARLLDECLGTTQKEEARAPRPSGRTAGRVLFDAEWEPPPAPVVPRRRFSLRNWLVLAGFFLGAWFAAIQFAGWLWALVKQ